MHISEEDTLFKISIENCSCDSENFTHIAHLRLGWIYLIENNLSEAINKITLTIDQYASSLGAKDKFHWTVTEALMHIICLRMSEGKEENFRIFLKHNLDLEKNTLSVLSYYYSGKILWSDAAKEKFIEPDLNSFL